MDFHLSGLVFFVLLLCDKFAKDRGTAGYPDSAWTPANQRSAGVGAAIAPRSSGERAFTGVACLDCVLNSGETFLSGAEASQVRYHIKSPQRRCYLYPVIFLGT